MTKDKLKQVKDQIESMSVENQPQGIGDLIDFSQLFRVKGIDGIWIPTSKAHKSGMISVTSFEYENIKKIVKRDNLISLLQYNFYSLNNDPTGSPISITIQEVFNNLNNHFIDVDIDSSKHIDKLMSVMVPNYSPEHFREYHAKQVLKWYHIIKNKVINIEKKQHVKSL